jgi:DNA-binding response OmpR family regulator
LCFKNAKSGQKLIEVRRAPIVLVVDDHAPLRTFCRAALEPHGIVVAEAADGTEAIESVRRERPDLILLDIMLPGLSGWEVAAILLRDHAADKIPIIFVSALTGPADRRRGLELGARDYLGKPVDPAALASTVLTHLESVGEGDTEPLPAETIRLR